MSNKKPNAGQEGLVGERKAKASVVEFQAKELQERQKAQPTEIPKRSINEQSPKDDFSPSNASPPRSK